MNRLPRGRILLLILVVAAALAGFAAVTAVIYTAGTGTRSVGAAVFAFAAHHNRMPASFDEMVQAGYARATGAEGEYLLLAGPREQPLGAAVAIRYFDVPWAVQPEQLVERDKGVFWRDQPEQRALLVRHRQPPWVVRALGGRMAMAFPVELYRQLSRGVSPQTRGGAQR